MQQGAQPQGFEVTAAEQTRKALDMRRSGMSHRAIASALGVSLKTAQNRLDEGLRLIKVENAPEARKLEADRLDYLENKLQDAVDAGDVKAIATAKSISESRRKLFGLDAPVQHDVTVTETTQADIELAELVREAKAKMAAEENRLRASSNGHKQ